MQPFMKRIILSRLSEIVSRMRHYHLQNIPHVLPLERYLPHDQCHGLLFMNNAEKGCEQICNVRLDPWPRSPTIPNIFHPYLPCMGMLTQDSKNKKMNAVNVKQPP